MRYLERYVAFFSFRASLLLFLACIMVMAIYSFVEWFYDYTISLQSIDFILITFLIWNLDNIKAIWTTTSFISLTIVKYSIAYFTIGPHGSTISFVLNSLYVIGMQITLTIIMYTIKQKFMLASLNASVDPLTQVFNRASFFDLTFRELTRSRRTKLPVALCYLDCDYFKDLNDQYGHDIGDNALVSVSNLIKSSIREYDIPARVGGDEFVIFFPDTNKNNIHDIVDRIQINYEKQFKSKSWHLTLSMGIACFTYTNEYSINDMIKLADKLMYKAKKRKGNNRNSIIIEEY